MDHPDLPNSVLAEQFQMGLPSRPNWIEPTVDYLQQRALLCGACEDTRMNKLTVSLHEALTNAVVHGNLEISSRLKENDDHSFAELLAHRAADSKLAERIVEVAVDYDGERCTWSITDQGNGFDFEQAIARAQGDDPELLLASGRGIMIMLSFMDDLHYEMGGRRLVLTLKRDSGLERRRFPRKTQHDNIEVAPIRADGSVDWDAAYRAVSRNLSADGIAVLQQQLEAGERILIGMFHGDKSVYMPARVRHVRTLTDDVVELGCQFQRNADVTLDEPKVDKRVGVAIDEFLREQQYQPLPEDDRREFPRVAFTDRIDVFLDRSTEPTAGFARDLSKGGISFITNVKLPKSIVVRFPKKLAGRELRVRAEVTRSTELHRGFYDIGASFVSLDVENPSE